jgi:hypothetical protein
MGISKLWQNRKGQAKSEFTHKDLFKTENSRRKIQDGKRTRKKAARKKALETRTEKEKRLREEKRKTPERDVYD